MKQPSPRNSQTGKPVYRVRTYSTSGTGDVENSEPLTGKQPGVLNVEAPSAVSAPPTCELSSDHMRNINKTCTLV